MELAAIFEKLQINYRKISKGFLISCPFAKVSHKNGTDNHPSMAVWTGINFFKCYSCGKSGSINSLLSSLNEKFDVQIDLEIDPLVAKLASLDKDDDSLIELSWDCLDSFDAGREYIISSTLWQQRGFDDELIEIFNLRANRDYLVFPVTMGGKLYGAVGRSFEGKKLYNFFGFSAGKTIGGIDQLRGFSKIAVVEGMTCLLNSYKMAGELGYDVVCTWTANVTKDQARILMDTGKSIHCWFDPDPAGEKGWSRLRELCGYNFGLTRHKIPQGYDVGCMDRKKFFEVFK